MKFSQVGHAPDERVLQLAAMPYAEYLSTAEWKARRAGAISRAGGRCQLCNAARKLNVHHRTYARRGNELPGDLIALCEDCHARFHGKTVPAAQASEVSTVTLWPLSPLEPALALTPAAARQEDPAFAVFWTVYPRKVAKAAARRMWARMTRTHSPAVIIAGAQRYAAERAGQDPQFTAHPATWLYQERWQDDTEAA